MSHLGETVIWTLRRSSEEWNSGKCLSICGRLTEERCGQLMPSQNFLILEHRVDHSNQDLNTARRTSNLIPRFHGSFDDITLGNDIHEIHLEQCTIDPQQFLALLSRHADSLGYLDLIDVLVTRSQRTRLYSFLDDLLDMIQHKLRLERYMYQRLSLSGTACWIMFGEYGYDLLGVEDIRTELERKFEDYNDLLREYDDRYLSGGFDDGDDALLPATDDSGILSCRL